ncbi:hypothetical protein SLA2020_370670 [Shorea laevis]
MKKNIPGTIDQLQKKKNRDSQKVKDVKSHRFLMTVNVLGSAGPLRFVVNENDLVTGHILTLRSNPMPARPASSSWF